MEALSKNLKWKNTSVQWKFSCPQIQAMDSCLGHLSALNKAGSIWNTQPALTKANLIFFHIKVTNFLKTVNWKANVKNKSLRWIFQSTLRSQSLIISQMGSFRETGLCTIQLLSLCRRTVPKCIHLLSYGFIKFYLLTITRP